MNADYCAKLLEYLNRIDRFAVHNKMRLTTITPGYAEAEMELGEHVWNGRGPAHGGLVYSLADLALAGAANSHGRDSVTQSSTIHYIRPGTGTRLRAVATELYRGNRTGLYQIEVFNDQDKLIARLQAGVFFHDIPLQLT